VLHLIKEEFFNMKYFITKNGKIINENNEVIPMDENNSQWQDYYNYLKNNGEVVEVDFEIDVELEVPNEVPLWCIKAILNEIGLLEIVDGALTQLEEPLKSRANYIWNYGNIIKRDSLTVAFIGQVLKKDKTEIDEIFINANNIEL